MTDPAIRIVNTSADDLQRCNVEHIVRVFGGISQVPGKAKALRGLVFLGFPSVEKDARPNWQIPEVRSFVRTLDAQMPHFCYFLTGNAPFGFLRAYMYCLLDPGPDGAVQSTAFQSLIQRLERDVRAFCDRIADRPETVIQQIMLNLPARTVRQVPELRRAALVALLPLLEAIANAADAPANVKRPAFREAEELLGKSIADCGSEAALIARVRQETGQAERT